MPRVSSLKEALERWRKETASERAGERVVSGLHEVTGIDEETIRSHFLPRMVEGVRRAGDAWAEGMCRFLSDGTMRYDPGSGRCVPVLPEKPKRRRRRRRWIERHIIVPVWAPGLGRLQIGGEGARPVPFEEAPKIIREAAGEGETLFAVCADEERLYVVPVKRTAATCMIFAPDDVVSACENAGMEAIGTIHTHPCSGVECAIPSGEDMVAYLAMSEELPLFCIASRDRFLCYYGNPETGFQEAAGRLEELPKKIEYHGRSE